MTTQNDDHQHDPIAPQGCGPATRARNYRLLLSFLDPVDHESLTDHIVRILGETGGCTDDLIAMIFHLAGMVVATTDVDTKDTRIAEYERHLAQALDELRGRYE
ncbi:MAG: hypothetical protein AB1925_15700 [Actinomycetota bacterium]